MSSAALAVGRPFTFHSSYIEQMQDTDFAWLRGRGDGVLGWQLPSSWLRLEILRLWLQRNLTTAGTTCDLAFRMWKNASSGAADREVVLAADGSTGWDADEDSTPPGSGLVYDLAGGDELYMKIELTGSSTPVVADIATMVEARLLAVSP